MKTPLWRGQLFVHQIESDAKYKDVIRVSQGTFRDPNTHDQLLNKNSIYKISVNKRTVFVALRGSYRPGISMDAITRNKLRIKTDRSYQFEFFRTGFMG